MAEIKSTLDIIMEKTKGLTMTEEEKEELRQKELSGKVRGLVQKFLDGLMDLETFRSEVAALGGDKQAHAKRIIKEEAVGRISLGADNHHILEMLEGVADMDMGPARDLLDEYGIRLEQEAASRMQALLDALEQKGITGSAVIPNLDADPVWKRHKDESQHALKEELTGLME